MLDKVIILDMENVKTYPIKAVSQITGLTAYVIRAWEKRYNVVCPLRTDTNRRLYTEEDVEKLILLREATERGHSIGLISDSSKSSLRQLIQTSSSGKAKTELATEEDFLPEEVKEYYFEALEAVSELNGNKLESILYRASVDFAQPQLFDDLLIPLIFAIGYQWKSGEIRIYNEHFASSIIRKFLYGIMESNSSFEEVPSIIVTTPRGQLHELGAMIYGAIAAADGWNVSYMGPNLPVEEITAAVKHVKAKAVILGIIYPKDDPLLPRELNKLRMLIGDEVAIIVGGRGVDSYKDTIQRINAFVSSNSETLRAKLNSLRGV